MDCVKTRLQAGKNFSQSLWGVTLNNVTPAQLSQKYQAVSGKGGVVSRVHMLMRSSLYVAALLNLLQLSFAVRSPPCCALYRPPFSRSPPPHANRYAGHRITAIGRFPYLFLNLGTYQQADGFLTCVHACEFEPPRLHKMRAVTPHAYQATTLQRVLQCCSSSVTPVCDSDCTVLLHI